MAVGVAIVGFPIWVVAAILLDISGHRRDPGGNWDAIIVAGCRVNPDGQASLSLVRRTEKAVELWRAGRAPVILFTGGLGKWPPTEAQAAANVAIQLGVPAKDLILEDRSTNTLENARNAAALLPKRRIVVVTDTYHVRRCEWFFGKYFESVVGVGAVSPLPQRATGSFREAIAYAYYLLVGTRTR
jgi:uncharacterized SAM-binding protein YcdF (DUF218 family)